MSNKKNFHFVGVCGTAMGSVAAAMKAKGYKVTGSDQNVYLKPQDFSYLGGKHLSKPQEVMSTRAFGSELLQPRDFHEK